MTSRGVNFSLASL